MGKITHMDVGCMGTVQLYSQCLLMNQIPWGLSCTLQLWNMALLPA